MDKKTPGAKAPSTIDEYISACPKPVQARLQEIRRIVHEAAPDAQERISYRMPSFTLNGNLVYFAAFAKHIGFYPIPSGVEQFKAELSRYKYSKGAVQFPLDEPLPRELIRKIVLFRAAENKKKAANRGAR
jgi:uncharacterized protein YdhG (YjbR/CyaY superfamily)